MQESLFTDPSPPVNQFAVHDRDLPCRSAERYKTQLHPEAKRLSESNGSSRCLRVACSCLTDLVCLLNRFSYCHGIFRRFRNPSSTSVTERSDSLHRISITADSNSPRTWAARFAPGLNPRKAIFGRMRCTKSTF